MSAVISVNNLHKRYGSTVAVDDVSFEVQPGEIFAILGPNGAGKSTTVETVAGLRDADSGTLSVLGLDPQRDVQELRRRLGIQLQQAEVPDRLKVWEVLTLFAAFYDKTVPSETLLTNWGLQEKRNSFFSNLSGGQKQRLFIALALINDPEIVIFDELTTGLDPQARRSTWELVKAVRDQGKTVILVTHGMDEAEQLADRIAIIDRGRVIALDTPQGLIDGIQQENRISFSTPVGFDLDSMTGVEGVSRVEQAGNQVTVFGSGPLMARVALALSAQGIEPTDLRQERANLEDVFLAMTGRALRS